MIVQKLFSNKFALFWKTIISHKHKSLNLTGTTSFFRKTFVQHNVWAMQYLVGRVMTPFGQQWLVYVKTSGLYCKPMTIVNDDSRVVNKLEASLTDDARGIIYNRHMFIVQAPVVTIRSSLLRNNFLQKHYN